MRWKVKPKHPTPKIHEVRYVMKFAWLPKRTENQIVWLEKYLAKEWYALTCDFSGYPYYDWIEKKYD